MSHRTKKNRTLLLWRIAWLAVGYALPLGGLALFFMITDIRGRIVLTERERVGVTYIRQLIEVHDQVVREIWGWRLASAADNQIDLELARLEIMERETAPQLFPFGLASADRRTANLTATQLRSAWEDAKQSPLGTQERFEDLVMLVGQLHALIAHTSDAAGLTFSTEAETGYVTDTLAFGLPVHLERLVQMCEQLMGWSAPIEAGERQRVAGVFFRQLEKEMPRLERNIRMALESDARSVHVSPAFHRDYPPAAATFLSELHRLSEALNPTKQAPAHVTDWEGILRSAYTESMEFWRFSAVQLDHLLEDQITHVKHERNAAIGLAALIVVTLLPLTWLYFSRYIRPVVQDMVDEVQEASEAAAKAKNQFLAMMSHEIRTPMNGVIGFANLLSETRLDEQQRDFVRTITGSSEALLTVINDILDYTKLEAGRVELESRPVVLSDLIDDVLGLLSTTASAKRLELVYWIEPDVPPVVSTDPTRLRQILLNLAGNAVKFTAAGHIELTVARAPAGVGGDRLSFHVRDTGIGIPPDRIERLFKPFSQVDSSITRTHGGTGLGLAISRRLVEAMGGEINVTSAPGKGTDFHFTIAAPAAKRTEEAEPGSSWSVSEVERALRGRRFLVIDDYEANRRLFERIFEPYGAKLTSVESAEAALAVLARETFDLAILDYMMPMMDGITLARTLAAQFPALPLMLVTSVHLSPNDPAASLFASVVTKPIRNRKFVATVMGVLRGNVPVAGRPAALAEPSPAAAKAPPFALQHPLRILAVDDNPVNLRVISMMLTSLGYAPVVTDRADKALECLRTDPFDLVLMDVQMPEMDGLEATRRLRGGECGPINRQVRVMALTAGASQEEREACRAAGMDDFILKPVTRPVLTEALLIATSAGKRKA